MELTVYFKTAQQKDQIQHLITGAPYKVTWINLTGKATEHQKLLKVCNKPLPIILVKDIHHDLNAFTAWLGEQPQYKPVEIPKGDVQVLQPESVIQPVNPPQVIHPPEPIIRPIEPKAVPVPQIIKPAEPAKPVLPVVEPDADEWFSTDEVLQQNQAKPQIKPVPLPAPTRPEPRQVSVDEITNSSGLMSSLIGGVGWGMSTASSYVGSLWSPTQSPVVRPTPAVQEDGAQIFDVTHIPWHIQFTPSLRRLVLGTEEFKRVAVDPQDSEPRGVHQYKDIKMVLVQTNSKFTIYFDGAQEETYECHSRDQLLECLFSRCKALDHIINRTDLDW